jgi:transcriptional regulator with XRE-family HTH domain
MDRIASIFKHQRELLGYSLEDLSVKTKLTIHQLQAIETGNINYFKDDITYFPFMVRFVANTLKIDYESIKPDVEQVIATFHTTQAFKKVQQRDEIHRSVNRKINKLGVKKKFNIDFTFVALMLLLTTLVIALVFTFFTSILPRLSQGTNNNNNNNNNDLINLPDNPGDDEPDTPTDPVEPEIVIAITEMTYNSYTITDFDETVKVVFKVTPKIRQSWIRFTLNGTIISLPATAIYPVNSEVVFEFVPTLNDEVVIRLGDMVAGNVEVSINDQILTLNPRFNTRTSNGGNAGFLTFRFTGE